MASPGKRAKRFHLSMMVVWAALVPPTLIWWSESILWVLLISIYANWVGHYSAYEAAKAQSDPTGTAPED